MKTHLIYDYLPRHQVWAAYCGYLVPKDHPECKTDDIDEVTCNNCNKPGVLKRHQIKQDEKARQ